MKPKINKFEFIIHKYYIYIYSIMPSKQIIKTIFIPSTVMAIMSTVSFNIVAKTIKTDNTPLKNNSYKFTSIKLE